jgi:hypothetical protein
VKAAARRPCRVVVPTKMAKARCLEIEREAMRIATENEKTIPMLAKVRSIPEEIPNTSGGEAFITAAELAGKNPLAPTPFTTLATTTSHSPL